MFQPPVFREDRIEVMHDLMRAHPFATLVSTFAGRLSADHVPLVVHPELSEKGVIRGHLAVANPLYREAGGPLDVLAVFQGPQAYVSPSWYPSKQDHGKVVPTWNYAVVHAHGVLRFHDDAEWLMAFLDDLTRRNEDHRKSPWSVSDVPEDYLARQLKGIVGIEIEVLALEGKWKISQNKDARDRAGVVQGLLEEGGAGAVGVSQLMQLSDDVLGGADD